MAIKQTMHIFGIFLVMLVVGCATGISQQSRSKVTYMGTFSELQKTPDAYVRVSSTSSELTVLQLALGKSGRPANLDQSEGRFLVRSEQFLDPATYQKGMLLTVVGILKGSRIRAIGSLGYVYPIVEAIEIKLWPKGIQTQPTFHFGFGVGTTF